MAEYPVVWSQQAEIDFYQLVDYLSEMWSVNLAEKFTDKLYDIIGLLATMPELGERSAQDLRVRRVLITSKNALYYYFDEERVRILRLLDTRQNLEDITFGE